MSDPLAGVEAKIKRGFDHVGELQREIGAFLLSQPYAVTLEPDDEPGWYAGIFHVLGEPPVELGIIGGEAMGQFRSALDHLMVRLIRLRHPSGSDIFPICNDIDQWRKRPSPKRESTEATVRRLLRPEHFAIVQRTQPYHVKVKPRPGLPKPHSLSVLQWFTNLDKHETVHLAFVAPSWAWQPPDPDVVAHEWTFGPPYVLTDKTKLYRVRFASGRKVDMPFPDMSIDLPFGPPPDVRINAYTIEGFGRYVRGLVADIRAVTPECR